MKKIFKISLLLLIIISCLLLIPLRENFYGKKNTIFYIRHFLELYKTTNGDGCCTKFEKLSSYFKIITKKNIPLQDRSNSKEIYFDSIVGFNIKFHDYRSLCFLFSEIFLNEMYFFKTDNKTPFIIDCGSNIGISILYFKKLYPNSKIIGFEPSTSNYILLENNIKNNGFKDVFLFKKAVYNKSDILKLYDSGNTTGTMLDGFARAKNYETIETVPLSAYINQKVDFLKLDIEGSETIVLEELAQKNKLKFIEEIIMEFHYNNRSKTNYFSKLFKILEDNNFKIQISGGCGIPFEKDLKPVLRQYYLIHAYH